MSTTSVLHLAFWWLQISSLYLQDANGPTCEALLSFSDLTCLVILPIAVGVFIFLTILTHKSPTYRYLTDSQPLEFTWTMLPLITLFILSIPSLSLLYLIDEVGFPVSTSKIQGHQWY